MTVVELSPVAFWLRLLVPLGYGSAFENVRFCFTDHMSWEDLSVCEGSIPQGK